MISWQNKLILTNDPLLMTDPSLYEPVFQVRSEWNAIPNGDKTNPVPAGIKAVKDFCKAIQQNREIVRAQNQGAAEVSAVLAEVKPPKVSLLCY